MSQDPLRNAFDTIRAQIQAQLDAQLAAAEQQHNEALELARTQVREEAEARSSAELNRVHADWESRLRAVAAEAAADADQRIAAATASARAESEQKIGEAVEQAKREAAGALERTNREAAETLERTKHEAAEALQRSKGEAAALLARAKREAESVQHSKAELQQELQAERSARAATEEEHRARLTQLESDIEQAHQRADALDKELAALRTRHEQEAAGARELLEHESARVRALTAELAQASEGRRTFEERASQSARDLESLRQSIHAENAARQESERTRQSLEAELSAAREHETTSRAAERQSQLAATERLLNAIQAIGVARSLSDALSALVNSAAAEASRAVVLVPVEGGLQTFRAAGFAPDQIRHPSTDTKDDVLLSAMREVKAVSVPPAAAPAFARLGEDRAGIAVPICVGGQAVAVLYADNGVSASPEVPAPWPEAVQILGQHTSAVLSHLTAVRTTQAMRLMRPPAANTAASSAALDADADQAARRYARLLVSEIKLYNESAVRIGREKRDLLKRLRPEIERARRLYEERVPQTVANREQYFDHELRQTLADGDASLLGQQTVSR